ncbi:MAG: DEAD/DEAH box helicase [Erysipelotrichaceae bacterium]|nr:DEAD/DEAH box helicase [Erysipelotrichaceae bacterium]
MKCNRCSNTDPRYFGFDGSRFYCRKCIAFGRLDNSDKPVSRAGRPRKLRVRPKLRFDLTPFQQKASDQALHALQEGRDVFVYAAAGAGKTEMTLASICWYLQQGKKVGFAISRRQVVLEIAKRMKEYFPDLQVISVCQGHASQLDGDLIVCTMHQLYRYPDTFDLLIMDEVDAFPFAGNPVLKSITDHACKGQKLMLSATPDEESLKAIEQGSMEMVQLFRRPHGKPLCVPKIKKGGQMINVLRLILTCLKFKKEKKQVLVFVPRKKDAAMFGKIFRPLFKCRGLHSSSRNKDEIMEEFYEKKCQILFCTTLLERGITVPSVQVLVYRADHPVFTTASLIQIFGRVGRTFQDPEGTGICYCQSVSAAMKECRRQLIQMNRSVSGA